MTKHIYVTRQLPQEAIRPFQEAGFYVEMWGSEESPIPRERLLEVAKTADGLVTMLSDQLDAEFFQQAGDQLKVVANLAVGYDNIDVKTAKERGILICHTPDVLSEATADLAFSLVLATMRRIVESADLIRNNKWTSWSPLLMAGSEVYGSTMGIVGMGSIGTGVAKRAKGFSMNVLYHNRSRKPAVEQELGVEYASFKDLLQKSDVIVCLTPYTKETHRLFDAQAFQLMKKTAHFVNVSRGAVVDEQALVKALQTEEIAGAGLDVFEKEPVTADHPLLQFPQVTALPHIGSASIQTRYTMMELCLNNIACVLKGEKAKTPIPEMR